MSQHEIPVLVAGAETPGENAAAVLREVASLLTGLVEQGSAGAIDLQSLPLSPADRAWLKDRLGKGEVEITLAIAGGSTITETAYAGVWWVEHRDEQGNIGSQFIEVAYVPDLVLAHPDDVENSLAGLNSELAEPR